MKSILKIAVLGVLFVVFAGCGKSSSNDDRAKQILKEMNDSIKKTEQEMQEAIDKAKAASTVNDRQPGLITLSGAIVKDDSEINSKIQISLSTGVDEKGTATSLVRIPELQSKPEIEDLSSYVKYTHLLSVNCSTELAEKIASDKKLKLQQRDVNDLYKVDATIYLHANTVMICGDVSQIKNAWISVKADEIILDSATLKMEGSLSFFIFTSNVLSLNGSNTVETVATDSLLGPSITLTVFNELKVVDENAKLNLKSTGANYIKAQDTEASPKID